MTEKTSAYVFPFKPFSALEQVEETANILAGKTVDIGYFQPLLDVVAPLVEVPEGDSLPERLLHFFADRRVCFGEPEWILQLAERITN